MLRSMDSSTPKKTALYDAHVSHGAKLVDFAGYLMPVRYSTLQEEHLTVRESVGVFDVSHMGEFMICLLYTSPSPRDQRGSRMPSSA